MNVVNKTEGKKIEYSTRGSKITFGDELMLNLESRERDTEMQIDICEDIYGCLVVGVSANTRRYVAQIIIPAREYQEIEIAPELLAEDQDQENGGGMQERVKQEALPFSMANCTLILWGMEE